MGYKTHKVENETIKEAPIWFHMLSGVKYSIMTSKWVKEEGRDILVWGKSVFAMVLLENGETNIWKE